jgi:hypothetical protein
MEITTIGPQAAVVLIGVPAAEEAKVVLEEAEEVPLITQTVQIVVLEELVGPAV